jgi:MoaA/NifB/PqqE/SkfB family radical SAM enzyme
MKSLRFLIWNGINYGLQKVAYACNGHFAKPTQIIATVTDSMAERPLKGELDTQEWMHVIRELKAWLGTMLYIHVKGKGGEPFRRDDLPELLRFTSSQQIKTFVNTNGLLLTESLARKIVGSGLDYLAVFLEGTRPETVNSFRQLPNAYQTVTSGLRYLNSIKRKGMLTGISVPVMQINLDELVPLVRWAEEQRFDRVGFHVLRQNERRSEQSQSEFQADRTWHTRQPYWVQDVQKLDAVLEILIRMKRRGSPITNSIQHLSAMKSYYRNPYLPRGQVSCIVGHNNFFIETDGTVKLCHWLDAIGTLWTHSPQQIWASALATDRRGQIKRCQQQCMTKALYNRSLREKMELAYFLIKKGAL